MRSSNLLVIIAILGIPAFIMAADVDRQEEARREAAKLNAQVLEKAVKVYIVKNEVPPETLDDLFAPAKGGPYLQDKKALLDPWDKTFQYEVKEVNKEYKIKIWTKAPDGTVIDNSPNKK